MITLTNSNSLPMKQDSVSGQKPVPPSSIDRSNVASIGPAPTAIKKPVQVMGLVPLFTCCNETATIYWDVVKGAHTVVFDLNIGGTDLGQFSSTGTDTLAQIEAEVDAILPDGFWCSASRVDHGVYYSVTVTIYSPVNSSSSYSGVTVTLTYISGTDVYGSTNFTSSADSTVCDCRRNNYGADYVTDDTQWTIPAFASTTDTNQLFNDKNAWLLKYPGSYNAVSAGDFKLQRYSSGIWTTVATLNSTTYGTPYHNTWSPKGTACTNSNYCGFLLDWRKVLIGLGEGTYRFSVSGGYTSTYPYCMSSPPFCLQEYTCIGTDGTVRFEANYSGGNMGSIETQGLSWSLCCRYISSGQILFSSISWYDAVRFYGYFGDKKYPHEKEQIKYQTGVIKKVRDEIIPTYSLKIGGGGSRMNAPMWLLDRFQYAITSDKLLVSDYNLNNSNYNIKRLWVVIDSAIEPSYHPYTRYMKVLTSTFKEGTQYTYRDRCC